jgi:hypothetical protein
VRVDQLDVKAIINPHWNRETVRSALRTLCKRALKLRLLVSRLWKLAVRRCATNCALGSAVMAISRLRN